MSDYETINMRVKAQRECWRNEAFKRLSSLLGKLVIAVMFFVGLQCIGFINLTFMAILISLVVCVGAFKAGWICRDIKF